MFHYLSFLLIVGMIGGSMPVAAQSLAVGPAFSDPSITVPMSDDWIKQPVDRGSVDLKVMMDQQMYRVLEPFIRHYAKQHGLKIDLGDGTCGHSAGALLNKKADIGGYCCPPRNTDRLPGLRFFTMGITPIAIVVHPGNPVRNVSIRQVREVFAGVIHRWSQLTTPAGQPGPNKPIQQVARLHCKFRPGHWRLLLDNEDLLSTNLKEVGTIPDMIMAAASNVRTVGHVSAWLTIQPQVKGSVNALSVNGVSPYDLDALIAGNYPFYKTFSLTVWEGSHVQNPHAKALKDFMLKQMEKLPPSYLLASPSKLRAAGWRFEEDELIGAKP